MDDMFRFAFAAVVMAAITCFGFAGTEYYLRKFRMWMTVVYAVVTSASIAGCVFGEVFNPGSSILLFYLLALMAVLGLSILTNLPVWKPFRWMASHSVLVPTRFRRRPTNPSARL